MVTRNGAVNPQATYKFAFTDNKVKKLTSPQNSTANQTEYSDSTCTGLKLILSHLTGRKMFHHRYRLPNGKKKSLKIGEFPGVTVESARKTANGNKGLLAEGIDPVEQRKKQVERLTFRLFVEQIYLPTVETRKRSWKDDSQKLNHDMLDVFGEKLLTDITLRDISTYINAICNRASKSTANRHRALLSGIFNMAISHDMISKNPVSQLEKFPESTDHGRCLSKEEVKDLISALNNTRNQVSGLAIQLLMATGMRKTECLKMEWRNVDFEKRFAKLEMETTKGKRTREVPLNDFALDILEKLTKHKKPDNPYVFPGDDGRHLTTVRKTFESCKTAAGIDHFRLHDCRHNFCSILASLGVSLYVIQTLVGHRSSAMTQRYSHLSLDVLQDTSQILSNSLMSAFSD